VYFKFNAGGLGQGTMLINAQINVPFHTLIAEPTALNSLTTLVGGANNIPSLIIHIHLLINHITILADKEKYVKHFLLKKI
jgi:hypothetical protein